MRKIEYMPDWLVLSLDIFCFSILGLIVVAMIIMIIGACCSPRREADERRRKFMREESDRSYKERRLFARGVTCDYCLGVAMQNKKIADQILNKEYHGNNLDRIREADSGWPI